MNARPELTDALHRAWTFAAAHEQSDAVRDIRKRFDDRTSSAPTVVVIGEAKRGKSSLINALVGAHVAPDGVDLVTGTHVAYVPSTLDHEVPRGTTRVSFMDGSFVDVPMEETPEWVAISGKYSGDERGIVSVVVRLPHARGIDLILVDTPGVSGLLRGHGQLALKAASDAAALLFVTDAGQDLTDPEIGFLRQAAETIDTVIFAETKIDKHPASWKEVLEHDRNLLKDHAPRFAKAPMIGVSNTDAMDAAKSDDAALRELSGIGELVGVLTERVADRVDRLSHVNALRSTITVLQLIETQTAERLAAVTERDVTEKIASKEIEALGQLRIRQQRWGEELQLSISRSRRQVGQSLKSRLSTLEHDWKARVTQLPNEVLRNDSSLRAEGVALSGELGVVNKDLLEDYAEDMIRNIEKLLEEDFAPIADQSRQLLELLGSTGAREFDPTPVPGQPIAELLLRHGFMGFGAAKIAAMAVGGISFPVLIPIAGGVALAMAWVTTAGKKVEVRRRQLLEHVMRSITSAGSELVTQMDALAAEFRPIVVNAIRDRLTEREAQLTRVIKEAQQAARSEPMERMKRKGAIERILQEASKHRATLERLLAQAMESRPRGEHETRQRERSTSQRVSYPW